MRKGEKIFRKISGGIQNGGFEKYQIFWRDEFFILIFSLLAITVTDDTFIVYFRKSNFRSSGSRYF